MLEKMHEHLSLELRINTRTDTIFVVTGIVFNFIMLAISSTMASEVTSDYGDDKTTFLVILIITLCLSLLVNGIAVTGLLTGRASRRKLQNGMFEMYKDAEIAKYYDETLLTNYMRRYVLFMAVIGLVGFTAILIPIVILITA